MTRTQKVLLSFAAACVALGVPGFLTWKRGEPYQEPYRSPNGKYTIQKYHNTSLNSFIPAMPGGGSDKIDGYIRCYDKDGKLLHERFETFIRDIEPVWAGDTVYLMGVAEMDNDGWRLPSSSE